MEKLGLNELRERFLNFFAEKEHLREKSAPLLPLGDNSLLLINSGMAPLKPYFTGEVTPPSKRMTTCQKCIRTPDIERVGKTSRHATYFEMLGNFSFGDYFKREACAWAWEFVTKEMKMPVDKLYVTVYLDDDETAEIWEKEIGVCPSRISRLGKADNFWEIGQGPCGPCSEIYFDRGVSRGCGAENCAPGCDCDRFVEFWNLVFTQFYNDGENNYTELESKNIDTGMGLERLACMMQDVESLFDVDTVSRITAHVSKVTGAAYGKSEKTDVSLRVITDHIRSTTMMICDGILPSNEGRGYVLRRLLRRAARHGKLLGVNKPFLFEIAQTVIAESECAYPELREKEDYIRKIIQVEEENFAKTIDAGMKIFDEMLASLNQDGQSVLSGEDAFKLYDTYGFPIDLTLEILEEQGKTVDRPGFDAAMEAQRQRARKATAALGDSGWEGLDLGLDKDTQTLFCDTKTELEGATLLAIVLDNEVVAQAQTDDSVTLVFDQTVFYAESGGQVADTGEITFANGAFEVLEVTKSKDGKFLHQGKVKSGTISKGDTASMVLDKTRRHAIMRAHSGAHLLHQALKNVLGSHVEQAGSYVSADNIRFDFTHFSALTAEEIVRVGEEVNALILADLPISISEMPIDEAKKQGAQALFGEKYGDVVRVVQMGDYSIELCGGTHLTNTAKIGPFWLISESSIASGVRRIEALVGDATFTHMRRGQLMLHEVAQELKTTPNELRERIHQLLVDAKDMRKTLDDFVQKQIKIETDQLLLEAETISDIRFITAKIEDDENGHLRKLGESLRHRGENIVAIACAITEGKISFLAICGKEAIAKGVKAGDLIKHVTAITGGSGGGRPDNAMGGGKDESKVDEALESVKQLVIETIGG